MQTWELHITGRVQGVGFRPHVYREARAAGLAGEVRNGGDGVRVRFNATAAVARGFAERLTTAAPPRAHVISHALRATRPESFGTFKIVESDGSARDGGSDQLAVAPDFATCAACLAEVADPEDRRYGYAFVTCTDCGPRYAIATALPYDRERTTMADFRMCEACAREYANPNDRRHHAQTNSCPACGVRLALWPARPSATTQTQLIDAVADALRDGGIAAVKGTSGYLLCCDAHHAGAVAELRRRKGRPAKPLAVLLPNLEAVDVHAYVTSDERAALKSAAGPIVLLRRRADSNLAAGVCGDSPLLGAMLPNSALFQLLSSAYGGALVATSANLTGEPIYADADLADVRALADVTLSHDLRIVQPQDDSVVRYAPGSGRRIIIRRGRGLGPALLGPPPFSIAEAVLAAGADLKASVGMQAGEVTYVSQALGDLSQLRTQARYRSVRDALAGLTSARPGLVLADAHPGYHSTQSAERLADALDANVRRVQHHEAHFASVLGEHGLCDDAEGVLGVVWDGTGLGDDGQVWGGEFFSLRQNRFRRLAHLPYFPHVGGDRMAREPRYAALAWAGGHEPALILIRKKFDERALANLRGLRERSRLQTSSVGRLFDAVASLLDCRDVQYYEGQAATALEHLARGGVGAARSLPPYGVATLCEELVADIGVRPRAVIAARFHLSLVAWVAQVAREHKARALCFSGGCFQNALLVDLLSAHFEGSLPLYFNNLLSPNDENIAYGQLVHAAMISRAPGVPHATNHHVLSHPR